MIKRKMLTNEQALQKLRHYCSYQERCHSEVRSKLYQLHVSKKFHDELIAELIQQNYLNEERFAIAFARGKFKMNQWGKRKIVQALKEKRVSEYCIKMALNQIPENDYLETIQKLVEKKIESLNGEKISLKKNSVTQYLIAKGFEPKLVLHHVQVLYPLPGQSE
jgi:regulatory protein